MISYSFLSFLQVCVHRWKAIFSCNERFKVICSIRDMLQVFFFVLFFDLTLIWSILFKFHTVVNVLCCTIYIIYLFCSKPSVTSGNVLLSCASQAISVSKSIDVKSTSRKRFKYFLFFFKVPKVWLLDFVSKFSPVLYVCALLFFNRIHHQRHCCNLSLQYKCYSPDVPWIIELTSQFQ